MGVDYVRELCRFQGREREESSPIRGRWRRNNVRCTLRGVHDNFRHRTVICITSKALVRVCYSRNDSVPLPTFGIVAGKPRTPMAQYAPGRTPPPRVGLMEWRTATTNAIRRYCRRSEASSECEAGEGGGTSRFGVVTAIGAGIPWRGDVGGRENPSRRPRGVLPNTGVG